MNHSRHGAEQAEQGSEGDYRVENREAAIESAKFLG